MKRTVIALTVTTLAVGGAGMASAKPGNGNGAVKTGLSNSDDALVLGDNCTAGPASAGKQTANGFLVLNAPGKPAKDGKNDGTRKLVGEVALKSAALNTTYQVRLASAGCGDYLGDLTTNAQGNGNFSFEDKTKKAGTYYVVLTQQPFAEVPILDTTVVQQSYASAPVTVK